MIFDHGGEVAGIESSWFGGGLRFKCTGCGACCTGASGRVYTRVIKGRRALIDQDGSHDCVFLANHACSVYEAQPTQCRTYPWWVMNLQDEESWEEAGKTCEGINHPDAPLILVAEILEQWRIDMTSEPTSA
jgi:Fe-S-cluster containining protein